MYMSCYFEMLNSVVRVAFMNAKRKTTTLEYHSACRMWVSRFNGIGAVLYKMVMDHLKMAD